jgi:biotin carboxyl carrier protein
MSFSKNVEELKGEIDGKQITGKFFFNVTELGDSHFIVTSSVTTNEVFLTSTGLLSDGNTIDGIDVKIESEKERIIRDRFAESLPNGAAVKHAKGLILKAPMPGMVKTISVAVGDAVQRNSQVLVLEAMKMENSIIAGFAGIVSKIHVEAGMSVEKNMPLIEFRKVE